MLSYERPTDVPSELRQELADWLLALADNKRVLGLRYGEWCTGAPELEADVSLAAMAQYELGHARLLRGVLAELDEDPRDEARSSDQATWRNLPSLDRPAAGWPEIIALNALVDGLLTINMDAATRGGLATLAQRLRKAVSEEHFHALHAKAWLGRLADAPEPIRMRVRAASEKAWTECLAFFGPPDDTNGIDRLAEAGIIDAGAVELRQRFIDSMTPLLDAEWDLGTEIDWSGWRASSRRHGDADFDEDSFAMITGAHARAMGVQD